jgi:hypothetical protein
VDISVFAFDDQPGTDLERNQAIAQGIKRYRQQHPQTSIIALMGNYHARQDSVDFDGVQTDLSGKLLAEFNPVSIVITHSVGSIWACMPECGVHQTPRLAPRQPGLSSSVSYPGYNYSYHIATLTASPPALAL